MWFSQSPGLHPTSTTTVSNDDSTMTRNSTLRDTHVYPTSTHSRNLFLPRGTLPGNQEICQSIAVGIGTISLERNIAKIGSVLMNGRFACDEKVASVLPSRVAPSCGATMNLSMIHTEKISGAMLPPANATSTMEASLSTGAIIWRSISGGCMAVNEEL